MKVHQKMTDTAKNAEWRYIRNSMRHEKHTAKENIVVQIVTEKDLENKN